MNRRTLSIIFFMAWFPIIISGQEIPQIRQGKFRLGIEFSPAYCYRSLKPANASNDLIIQSRDKYEKPKTGFSTGVTGIWDITSCWSLHSGVLFSNLGCNGKSTKIVIFDTINEVRPLPVSIRSNQSFLFIVIPAKAEYSLVKGKLKYFVAAGIETNIFLTNRAKTYIRYDDGSTGESVSSTRKYFHDLALAMAVSAGITYPIGQQWELRVEPECHRFISSVSNTPIKMYPYAAGLNFALLYHM